MIDQPRLAKLETSFVASLLTDPSVIDDASGLLRPDDLYSAFLRDAYRGILKLHTDGAVPDAETLTLELEPKHGHEVVLRVAELFTDTPTSANAISHAKKIKHVAVVRGLRNACDEFIRTTGEDPLCAESISRLADSVQRAEEVSEATIDCFQAYIDQLEDRMRVHQSGERPALLSTGFPTIDRTLGGGLGPGIHVIAAWSSMGKSAFGTTLLTEAMRHNFRPRVYSFDMPGSAYISRIAQRHAGVGYSELLDGSISPAKAARVVEVVDRLRARGMTIVDRQMTSEELTRDAWRHRTRLGCIVIDHLGKISGGRRGMREYDITCESMRAVNALYKRLNVPIILMAQLNNPPDRRERDDQKEAPMPSENEIRGGRQVTADAATVILPWRANYGRTGSDGCEARIVLAKNQAGKIETAECWWDGIRCEFREVEL